MPLGRIVSTNSTVTRKFAPAITRWVVRHTHPVVASLDGLAGEFSDHEALLRSRKENVISHLERARDLIRDVHAELAQGRVVSDSFLGLEGGALLPKWPFPEFERLF